VLNPLPASPDGARKLTGGGRGLRGMQERVAILGGQAECGPCGDDWRVRVVIPA
jgi:glucose-6-phosphate-specific signal transduction histidine kinase